MSISVLFGKCGLMLFGDGVGKFGFVLRDVVIPKLAQNASLCDPLPQNMDEEKRGKKPSEEYHPF